MMHCVPLTGCMKPILFKARTWWRLGLGAGALLICVTVATLEPVDYAPYFEQPYYQGTLERLQQSSSNNPVVMGELKAGFGRALLTPLGRQPTQATKDGFQAAPLAGYGARKGKPAVGVHDDVYVKAVAFQVNNRIGVMVGADALIIPREVAERATAQLRKELGLAREQIYFGATHTHSSLGGWGKGKVAESFAGPYNEALSKWFSAQLEAAVRTAVEELKPAALGAGSFTAPEFVRNRLVGKLGAVDPEFTFALIKQSTGRVAVIGSYAAHATVLSAGNMEFSADYPGCWEREVEQATGGVALFLAGGVGSHSPNPGAVGFDGAEKMGRWLAELVRERLSAVALTNVVCFGLRGLEVTLPPLHARLTDQVRLRPWVTRELLPVFDTTFVQAFRLNNAVWISMPCDFSGELALEIKDFANRKGLNSVVTSFNGDYIGYVIPARYYHLSGYEPRLMSFYGPATAEYLEDLARRLAVSVSN